MNFYAFSAAILNGPKSRKKTAGESYARLLGYKSGLELAGLVGPVRWWSLNRSA